MNPDIKQQWITALRSGDYEQGRGALAYEGTYCCLGVLCELAVKAGVVRRIEGRLDAYSDKSGHPETHLAPAAVAEWADLGSIDGLLPEEVDGCIALSTLNDSAQYTFDQIADVIEEQF